VTRAPLPLLALSLLLLPACDGTPSDIAGAPIVFAGTLVMDGGANHFFVVTSPGGVQVEIPSIEAVPELEEGFVASMGFGLGQRDDEDACQLTYSASVQQGFRIAFGLVEGEYCLRVFDNNTVGEDASRLYELRVTPSS
jgi:hypothetical protein